jgi:DnaJ-class molecular chaperone
MHLILVLQVRSAYRTLAAKHHPDRQAASEVETTEEEFKRVRMRNPAIPGYQV